MYDGLYSLDILNGSNLLDFWIRTKDLDDRKSGGVGLLVDGDVDGDALEEMNSSVQNVQRRHGRVQHPGSFVQFFQATPNLK